jgi:hypothetical protein
MSYLFDAPGDVSNGHVLTAEEVAAFGPSIESHDDLQAAMSRHFRAALASGAVRVDSSDRRSDDIIAGDAGENFMTFAGEKMLAEIIREPQTTTLMTPGPGQVLPIRQELARGDIRLSWEMVTPTGSGSFVDAMGLQRVPDVGEFTEKLSTGAAWTGVGYGWGMTELWMAQARARNIPTSRATNARSTLQRFNERLGLHGDLTHEIPGLFTQNQGYQVSMGDSFTTLAGAGPDVDGALLTLQAMDHYFSRLSMSYGGGPPTTVLAPKQDAYAFQRLRYGTNGEGDPLLETVAQTMPWTRNIRWIDGLERAGTSGGPLWLMWADDPGEFWNELGATPMLFGPFVDGGGLRTRFVLLTHVGGPVLRRRERFAAYSFTP